MASRRMDRTGLGLLAAGGCLTLVVVPIVALGSLAFALMLMVGFAEHPAEVAQEGSGILLAVALAAFAISIAGLAVLVLALRGRAWAQVVVLVAGVFLAFVSCPFPERLGRDYQRPEDVQFTLAQLAVSLVPACMAAGALLRLVARRGPPRPGSGDPPGPPARAHGNAP